MDVDFGRGRLGAFLREWATPVALALLVIGFACGSSSISSVKTAGLHARWVALLAVLVIVAAAAWARWSDGRARPSRGLVRFGLLAGSFLGLALLSVGWSVAPKLTFERTASLGLLFGAGALLAYMTEADARARRRALAGLAGGAMVVALLGIVMVAIDRSDAVQQASPTTPWRFRGFTENPNTISILAAVVLPIIAWFVLTTRESRLRVVWILGGCLLLGSVIAAESRGGLLAGTLGLAVVCLAQVRPIGRLVLALVVLAVLLGGGIEVRAATDPGQAPFVSIAPPVPVAVPGKGGNGGHGHGPAVHLARTYELPGEQSEIGHPLLSRTAASVAGSGRVAEWKGVIKQAQQRPLLGYGFGTEERVFVDRWYYFEGGTAENSYLGLLLQLGGLGELLLCGLGAVLAVGAVRRLRRSPLDLRGEVAAELGVLAAAAALMLIQSYIYSVGNVASGTVWVALFLLGSHVLQDDREPSHA